jgi:hypothetical protein
VTDPVADLERFLAELTAQRAAIVKELGERPHPETQSRIQQLLEEIDQTHAQLEASRPRMEALKARLVELEKPLPPPPMATPPAPPTPPPGWPLSDERIHGMIRELVHRARPPASKTAAKPRKPALGDVSEISSSTWNAEAFPSPSNASDVRDIDSRFWKQADADAESDEWKDEGR